MAVQLDPPQPDDVAEAVAKALEVPAKGADPWWQAGVEENLET